jgi:hypothetical protein
MRILTGLLLGGWNPGVVGVFTGNPCLFLLLCRKINVEAGETIRLALNLNITPKLQDDAVADGQA